MYEVLLLALYASGGAFVLFVVLPLVAYFMAKMVTLGYLQGLRAFRRLLEHERREGN